MWGPRPSEPMVTGASLLVGVTDCDYQGEAGFVTQGMKE